MTSANTQSFGVTISDVTITGATAEGIDVNHGSSATTSTVSLSNVSVTSTGTGINLTESLGTLTITGFSGLTISGNTAGSGIVVSNATFDGTAGGAYTQVAGGATAVGDSVNPVGGAGVVLTNVSGDLAFTDLDIFSGNGAGLLMTGTGAVNTAAGTGTRVTVAAGAATLQSTGGPVVDVTNATIDLPLGSATVTSSPTTGISLVSVSDGATNAAFSAASGSIAGTAGVAFNVSDSNATIGYSGAITKATDGRLVDFFQLRHGHGDALGEPVVHRLVRRDRGDQQRRRRHGDLQRRHEDAEHERGCGHGREPGYEYGRDGQLHRRRARRRHVHRHRILGDRRRDGHRQRHRERHQHHHRDGLPEYRRRQHQRRDCRQRRVDDDDRPVG